MSEFRASVVGFDITPRIHPTCGAWGCNPGMNRIDMPLLARCVALEQDDRRLVWFGSDLCGDSVPATDALRREVAEQINLPADDLIWSTSQTHSSGSIPGSSVPGGCSISARGADADFAALERRRFTDAYVDAARHAIETLRPAKLWVGKGYCDSMSYNTRFPMPNGGVKFSRHHGEGLQSGKFYDPTIGLMRFDDARDDTTMGTIFNFCAHPATMINDSMISPDWVGTARQLIEEATGGAPAMFVQGFCGDVNCRHIFGTPELARRNGQHLGNAAADALRRTMVPVRAEPLRFEFRTIELQCRPMYARQELKQALAERRAFVEELQHDPKASWFSGINAPEFFNAAQKTAFVQVQIDYLTEAVRMLDAEEQPRTALPLRLGAIRLGDVVCAMSPGENFTMTGLKLRQRSPFAHTLVCGDTNGLFGYIGDDAEIARGGYETDSYWKMLYIDGFRLAPARGTVDRILDASIDLLRSLQ